MTGRLRPWSAIDDFQHAATDFLYEHDEALAVLETGSGKTLISMTAGDELVQAGTVRNPLVLAPLRVAQITWPDERVEWAHLRHVRMVEWGGEPALWADSPWKRSRTLWGQRENAEARLRKTADTLKKRELEARIKTLAAEEKTVNREVRATPLAPGLWHVTSHENVPWLCALYEPGESPFDLWIVDEIGRFKNPKSPRYKALAKHVPKARIRWGLNATPAPEGLLDLFAQVRVLDGGRLWGKSFYGWRSQFFTPADYMGYSWRPQLGAFEAIMADLNKIAFRVPAEALAYQKTARHMQVPVLLPEKARAAYDEMEKTLAVELATLGIGEASPDLAVVAMSKAAASQKLRQIVQGYIYEVDLKSGARTVHRLHDEKTEALAELIDSMGREPLLVAYEFDEDLENIRRIWKNVPYLGAGVSSATARENIERWNRRELPVLAVHPASASHGLNLQYGGHHVCWLALPWALDAFRQTTERLDRRGQAHNVLSHHIVARDTIDMRVSDVLAEKDASQQKVIGAIRSVV